MPKTVITTSGFSTPQLESLWEAVRFLNEAIKRDRFCACLLPTRHASRDEKDLALEQLSVAARMPGHLSYGQLRTLTGTHCAVIQVLRRLWPRLRPNSVTDSLVKGVLLDTAPS